MFPHFERLFNKWLEAKSITPNDKDKSFLRKIFLSEVYGNFYKEQKAFLDSLGVRAMITDQNFWEGYSVTLMRKYYDIIDTQILRAPLIHRKALVAARKNEKYKLDFGIWRLHKPKRLPNGRQALFDNRMELRK